MMLPNFEQQIRARAYQIWEESGCLDGCADEHWRMAEHEIVRSTIVAVKGARLAPVSAQNGAIKAPRKASKPKAAPRKSKAA